jgi:hypothetical protein
VSLENLIGSRLTGYALQPVVRIGLSQRFPPPRDFLGADTNLCLTLADLLTSFSIVHRATPQNHYAIPGRVLESSPKPAAGCKNQEIRLKTKALIELRFFDANF